MDKNKKTYTTKDIAKLANVSRGTVDRILHGRGSVSQKSRQKVEDVLKQIDYKPNVLARTLQSSKTIRIAAILPSEKNDMFWADSAFGLEEASEEYSTFGVNIDQYFFNQSDTSSFEKMAQKVLDQKPDGVIIVPFFYKESVDFFIQCISRNIPYIMFNTHVEDAQALSFVGQDLVQSGRMAANLMLKTQSHRGNITIFHFDEDISNSIHMQQKEDGFKQFLQDAGYDLNLISTVNIKAADDEELTNQLGDLFGANDNVSGIFVTTSKAYKIAKFLKWRSFEKVLIGYDLLEENLMYLVSGQIDYLIHQNPRKQAHSSISFMVDHLLFRKSIPKQNLLPLDIVIPENVNSYLDTHYDFD